MWKVIGYYRSSDSRSHGNDSNVSPGSKKHGGPSIHCATRVVEKAISRGIFTSEDVARVCVIVYVFCHVTA